ncbi:MAG: response regulator [Bdellovibrionales bacterium]|nr:response regulator [Bdellovibrionales bacterium]
MNKKVLIVEDDKNLAESLNNIFNKKKIEAKVVHSVQKAEHFCSLDKYGLLIVDVVLPKVNGIDFLKKIIAQGLLDSQCTVWVISGVLNQHIISKDIKDHVDSFLKKPLNLKSIEEKIDTLFDSTGILLNNLPFFYMDLDSRNKVNILNSKKYIIAGHEIMFIWSYLSAIRFNGVLSINSHDTRGKEGVLFENGNIVSFKKRDGNSYLGVLLVKNKLVSKKDIQALLNEDTDVPLGERLVKGCYISPHHLHKMLKEQLAIRLFQIMGHSLLSISCVDFTDSKKYNYSSSLDKRDFLSLVNNWLKSKVNKNWLKDFFHGCKDMYIKPLKNPSLKRYFSGSHDLAFLSSPAVTDIKKVSEVIKEMDKVEEKAIRELYCRILMKESSLEYPANKKPLLSSENYESLRRKYINFLKAADKKNYFELMHLPLNAPVSKIEESYKSMVKIFHPDRRNRDIPEDLAKVCDKCFILISEIYQTLSHPEKKEKYLKKIEAQTYMNRFSVKEMYMAGKKDLNAGLYTSALKHFEGIFSNRLAPNDTILYYLWSQVKSAKSGLSKEEQNKMKELFDNVALDCRQTALFYFVKGLFMKEIGYKKAAFNCFSNALLIDSKLTVARIEKNALGKIQKKSLKSSVMALFKKGA